MREPHALRTLCQWDSQVHLALLCGEVCKSEQEGQTLGTTC